MRKLLFSVLACAPLVLLVPVRAYAQAPSAAAPAASDAITTPCGNSVAPPTNLPPQNSGPVVWILEPCFPKQGNTSSIESETYMYYIKLRPSQPSQGIWIPYNDTTEETIRSDFKALWGTKFLDDLSIEKTEYTFPNGVV